MAIILLYCIRKKNTDNFTIFLQKYFTYDFTIRFKYMNNLIVKNELFIPLIDKLLDKLQSLKFFSKLDLNFGYHQVIISKYSIKKTTIRTHHGYNEFKVIPNLRQYPFVN